MSDGGFGEEGSQLGFVVTRVDDAETGNWGMGVPRLTHLFSLENGGNPDFHIRRHT